MKKLFKILPLVLVPFLLASCDALKLGGLGGETGSSEPGSGTGEGGDPTDTNVYPSSLAISGPDSVTLGDNTKILTATYEPSNVTDKKVSWSSNNESVAKVIDGGKLRPQKVGDFTAIASMKGPNGTTITATKDMTVAYADATSVSLSISSKSLGYGDSVSITATVNPKGSANQTVNWTTSNSSIASLNYSQTSNGDPVTVTAGNSIGSATITATALDGTHKATCTINVSDEPKAAYTLLFYVCGANLESGVGYEGYGIDNPLGCASSDIAEILSTNGQPDDVNIVLECGGSKKWKNSTIDAHKSYLSRWHISNKTLIHDEDVTKASMGKTSTLQSFLEYGINTYPAEKYGLFMWNHGGAMDGCCYDENFSDDCIKNKELYDAVLGARSNCGLSEKLEFIAYDACLMAVQDVAEFNSLNFNYMISSQETEWDGGYDYDAWLPTLYANPSGVSTQTLLEKIGDTFMDYFSYQDDQTQSVYDLSKLEAYKNSFETLVDSLKTVVNSQSKWETFIEKVHSCSGYGGEDYSGYGTLYAYDVYDAKQVLQKIKTNYSSLSSLAQDAIDDLEAAVTWHRNGNKSTVKNSCGMSLFCPIDAPLFGYGYNKTSEKAAYLAQTHFTKWADFAFTYDSYNA